MEFYFSFYFIILYRPQILILIGVSLCDQPAACGVIAGHSVNDGHIRTRHLEEHDVSCAQGSRINGLRIDNGAHIYGGLHTAALDRIDVIMKEIRKGYRKIYNQDKQN